MVKSLIITILLGFLSISTAFAKEPIRTVEGVVTKVSDGDTVAIKDDLGTKLKICLYGIDSQKLKNQIRKLVV